MPRYTIRVIKTYALTVEAPSYEAAHRYYAGPDCDKDLFKQEQVGTMQLKEINKLSMQNPTIAEVEVDAHGNSYSS